MRPEAVGWHSPERGDLSKIWGWVVVLALAFVAMGVVGQTTPSTQAPIPLAAQGKPALDTSPTVQDTQTLDNTAGDAEIQRRFDKLRNELRRELLDDRADTIDWWLTATALFLTLLGALAAFLSIIGFSRFREIEAEAKKSIEEAQRRVEEINELNKRAGEATQQIERERGRITRASVLSDDPDRARQAEEASPEVPQKSAASPLDRAITEALSLQQAGKIEEAIEKWRSIANVAEGSDPDLAAHAWFSVGYLLYKKEVEDAGEQ
jgi:hypothetical protein